MVVAVLTGARAVVTTLAGGISGTTGAHADGSGSNAGFSYPWGVVVDASGNLFVADNNNQRIRKVTADGGTLIGLVTLRALAVRILAWQHRRERVGRVSRRCSPCSHCVVCLFVAGLTAAVRLTVLFSLRCCFAAAGWGGDACDGGGGVDWCAGSGFHTCGKR